MGGPLEPAVNAHVATTNLSKRFGAAEVLDRVDLAVERGALVTLLGPSGCGKTTLLRLIAGLVAPDEGSICDRRGRCDAHAAAQAQRRSRLPELCALSAPDGRGKRRLRSSGQGPRDALKSRLRSQRALALVQMERFGDRPVRALVRRPAAARGAGARAGGRAERASLRRSAERARPQPARDDAGRAAASLEGSWRDRGLRHPRPGRGADNVRQGRGHERGADRTIRRSGATLCAAAQPVRDALCRRFVRASRERLRRAMAGAFASTRLRVRSSPRAICRRAPLRSFRTRPENIEIGAGDRAGSQSDRGARSPRDLSGIAHPRSGGRRRGRRFHSRDRRRSLRFQRRATPWSCPGRRPVLSFSPMRGRRHEQRAR